MIQKTRKTMQIIQVILLLTAMDMVMAPVSATIFIGDGAEIEKDALLERIVEDSPEYTEESVVFFYDPDCGACTPAHDFLKAYLAENPDTTVKILNLADSNKERELFDEFKKQFNRKIVYTPVLYIGPIALEGSSDIKEHFEKVYTWYVSGS